MALQWTQDLSVGVSEIDNQHKELFRRANDLFEAMSKGKGSAEVGKVLDFLETYVVTHFGTEEKLMAKYAYSGYAAHKSQHAGFVKDFAGFKKEFQTQGGNSVLAIRMQRHLGDWLIGHISKTDKSLGEFMLAKV